MMTLKHKVSKSADQVFSYLTDMQKFVSVHPVIYKIELLQNNQYLFFETLRIAFIPCSFSYPGTVEHDSSLQKVTMRAVVMKITKIEIVFHIQTRDNYTFVDEQVSCQSPLPVRFVMEKIFRKQHTKLFSNIDNSE